MYKKHVLVETIGGINPNSIKGWYFPNWFNKEHFELMLSKKLNNAQFERIKEYLDRETDIADEVSRIVSEYLHLNKSDIL